MLRKRSYLIIATLIIITYIFITGVVLFGVQHPTANEYLTETDPYRFWGESYTQEQVALVEDGDTALKIRLDWIAQANNSIDLAYHSLHDGIVTDVLLASLIEAADRGVQIRILMDGIFHGLYFSQYDLRYLFQFHPNIEYRLYEPLDLLRPWTWNNRLHDKLMIVDDKFALISGRNLGDRYYLPPTKGKNIAIDRDLILYNLDQKLLPSSGIAQMKDYFNMLWTHPYTANQKVKQTRRTKQRAVQKQVQLSSKLKIARTTHPEYFTDTTTWIKLNSVPAKQITLIHNPIQRGNKEPWVWAELVRLMELADTSVIIQSPYVIPTKAMLKYIDSQALISKEITLITNSLAISPNFFAVSGYLAKKNLIETYITQVWEYFGPGSLHAKAIAIDNELSIIGSFNIDARSSFLSTETMIVVHSEELNHLLRQAIKERISTTDTVLENYPPPISWHKALGVRVIQPLVKIFDYLL